MHDLMTELAELMFELAKTKKKKESELDKKL